MAYSITRQFVGILIGVLICIALLSLLSLIVNSSQPQGAASITIEAIILAAIAACTPQFIGAVCGRAAGLLTGGIGSLVGLIIALNIDYAQSAHAIMPISQFGTFFSHGAWSVYVAFALVGFISGYAARETRGRYNIGRTLGFSILGIIAGTILVAVVTAMNEMPVSGLAIGYLILWLEVTVAYIVADVIILPIAKVAYCAVGDLIHDAKARQP